MAVAPLDCPTSVMRPASPPKCATLRASQRRASCLCAASKAGVMPARTSAHTSDRPTPCGARAARVWQAGGSGANCIVRQMCAPAPVEVALRKLAWTLVPSRGHVQKAVVSRDAARVGGRELARGEESCAIEGRGQAWRWEAGRLIAMRARAGEGVGAKAGAWRAEDVETERHRHRHNVAGLPVYRISSRCLLARSTAHRPRCVGAAAPTCVRACDVWRRGWSSVREGGSLRAAAKALILYHAGFPCVMSPPGSEQAATPDVCRCVADCGAVELIALQKNKRMGREGYTVYVYQKEKKSKTRPSAVPCRNTTTGRPTAASPAAETEVEAEADQMLRVRQSSWPVLGCGPPNCAQAGAKSPASTGAGQAANGRVGCQRSLPMGGWA